MKDYDFAYLQNCGKSHEESVEEFSSLFENLVTCFKTEFRMRFKDLDSNIKKIRLFQNLFLIL